MSEVRKTTLSILSLYVLSTLICLGVTFGTWYFGEIYALKNRSFYDSQQLIERLIPIIMGSGEYATEDPTKIEEILQAISSQSGSAMMLFDIQGRLIYNNTPFRPRDIPTKEGIYIIKDHVLLNSFGLPDFVVGKKKKFRGIEDLFRIVLDRGDIGALLWALRLKVWGLFALFAFVISLVGFFLVKLSLRPIYQKFREIDNFIKDTTHEINTPLSVLQMGIEQINQDRIPQEELKKIRYIQIASKTLSNLYSSLVYASFGGIEKKQERIDFKQLIEERLRFFAMLFGQKNIAYEAHLQTIYLFGDHNHLALVVDNLLSNACKYTPKGGKIEIFLGIQKHKALFWVKDNGLGIAPENISRVFNRYERFNPSNGGFGLGLNIVKKICDDLKIEIICLSELGKGSQFILSWELEKLGEKIF